MPRSNKTRATKYKPTIVSANKILRWQSCNNIAKFLYYSSMEDVELVGYEQTLQKTLVSQSPPPIIDVGQIK